MKRGSTIRDHIGVADIYPSAFTFDTRDRGTMILLILSPKPKKQVRYGNVNLEQDLDSRCLFAVSYGSNHLATNLVALDSRVHSA